MADMRQVPVADLTHMLRALRELGDMQVQLGQNVSEVARGQDATRSELTDLISRFEEFRRQSELTKQLQLAETRLIAVRQELETDYGHYATVRRQATGILQALDAGIVTQELISQATEELMISTPRYWLAPALVALGAWIADDRDVAERALGEALRRDNDKTSLFYALVLRRHGRSAAANRWLAQYLARQDPAGMSRELTVIIDAMATGALGTETRPMVREAMDSWLERMSADQAAVEEQVLRWSGILDGMRGDVPPGFTVLPTISPTWPLLADLYRRATVHGRLEAHLRGLFDADVVLDRGLAHRVDDILTSLVTNFDTEEMPLRRQEHELEAIVRHEGDRAAAVAEVAVDAPVHQETVNFLTLITNAASHPEQVGASHSTRLLAIATAKAWIGAADARLEAESYAALPDRVQLVIGNWTGEINGGVTEQQLAASLAAHIDRETDKEVAAIRFTGAGLIAAIGSVVALVIGIATLAGGGAGFWLLLAALMAGYAGYRYSGLPGLRRQVRTRGVERRTRAVADLRGAVAETVDWRRAWDVEMSRAESVQRLLTELTRDAFLAAAPDQRREVFR